MASSYKKSRKYSDEQLDKIAQDIHAYCDRTDFPLVIGAELECGDFWDGEFQNMAQRYTDHHKFCESYRRLENLQKHFLAHKGLDKTHDSSLTKFFLSCCHGMTEKQHIVQETIESCIEADSDEVDKAEAFEKKRSKVKL